MRFLTRLSFVLSFFLLSCQSSPSRVKFTHKKPLVDRKESVLFDKPMLKTQESLQSKEVTLEEKKSISSSKFASKKSFKKKKISSSSKSKTQKLAKPIKLPSPTEIISVFSVDKFFVHLGKIKIHVKYPVLFENKQRGRVDVSISPSAVVKKIKTVKINYKVYYDLDTFCPVYSYQDKQKKNQIYKTISRLDCRSGEGSVDFYTNKIKTEEKRFHVANKNMKVLSTLSFFAKFFKLGFHSKTIAFIHKGKIRVLNLKKSHKKISLRGKSAVKIQIKKWTLYLSIDEPFRVLKLKVGSFDGDLISYEKIL